MIYQVRANLFFTEKDEARDFYRDCYLALSKSQVLNPGTEAQEAGLTELIANYHDQDPNQPCHVILSDTNEPLPGE